VKKANAMQSCACLFCIIRLFEKSVTILKALLIIGYDKHRDKLNDLSIIGYDKHREKKKDLLIIRL
jgi:hypothetical protein